MTYPFGEIRASCADFITLVKFHQWAESQPKNEKIIIDFNNFFDANMCAPLGAILKKLEYNGYIFEFRNFYQGLKTILKKNSFLKQYGFTRLHDHNHTTIQYVHYQEPMEVTEETQQYVSNHFYPGKMDFPNMTNELLKEFRKSLYELFDNAKEHSDSPIGVFACGQFFPNLHKIKFTITDLGIGFHGRIYESFGENISSVKAIQWALNGNTTKEGKSGGLGLQLIKDFINLNNGRFVIVSGDGYWVFSKKRDPQTRELPFAFPGTVVTIEINTADENTYCLSSELNPADIF